MSSCDSRKIVCSIEKTTPIGTDQLNQWIIRFYEDILEKRYQANIEKQLSTGFFGYRRKAYDIGKMHTQEDLKMMRPVDFGGCKDNQFPVHCMDDCRKCKYFVFSPPVNDYQHGIKWLEDYSRVIEQKIDQQINMMKIICGKTTNLNKEEVEQDLKYISRNFQHYMDQKINIDMQLLENFINNGMENEVHRPFRG